MDIQVVHRPAYAMAVVNLEYGERFWSESGAFVSMNSRVKVRPAMPGGVFRSAARKVLGGESFFLTGYEALQSGAWVTLAPAFPGDICDVEVPEDGLVIQAGSYLGHSEGVTQGTEYGGLARIAGKEGAFLVTLDGEGHALLSSYGAIQRFDLGPGDELIVDTGHFVASGRSVEYRIGTLQGVTTSVLSGEGLVAQLRGPGPVFTQTRSPVELRSWLFPPRPQDGR